MVVGQGRFTMWNIVCFVMFPSVARRFSRAYRRPTLQDKVYQHVPPSADTSHNTQSGQKISFSTEPERPKVHTRRPQLDSTLRPAFCGMPRWSSQQDSVTPAASRSIPITLLHLPPERSCPRLNIMSSVCIILTKNDTLIAQLLTPPRG